jgi:choline-sulfatase
MSGRYPAGHGARHNGVRVDDKTPLLAEALARNGFATGAFVGAFPLDRRFGLERGFQTYSDRMPRVAGRLANERPGRDVVTEAIAWLEQHRTSRFFLWVHLFEPHAPYGAAGDARPAQPRYDDEIAETDRQVGRLVDALAGGRDSTLVVVAGDHGEAFGEHGEISHSIFVYDTTLRVPLVMAGPGIGTRAIDGPVSLLDVAPTTARQLGIGGVDADGIDLTAVLEGGAIPARQLYAESFAPLLDFGWSPLRSVREGGWKIVDAPRPELFHVDGDPLETHDLAGSEPARVATMREDVQRYSKATLDAAPQADRDAASRLQALGYVGGRRRDDGVRPDPKDRGALAADLARVTSGELRGRELEAALRRILGTDPNNPQAHMRLGFVLQESQRCAEALRHFASAIEQGVPGADAHLGRAGCLAAARKFEAAETALRDADRAEPGNPVVAANLGIVLSDGGRPGEGIAPLQRALTIVPDFHEARFNLAVAYARTGRREEAAREAEELLRRLPQDAPQRPEVQRLLGALQ